MNANYSIIIPTNARPYCLERLLRSLEANLSVLPQQTLVGNSTSPEAPEWVHRWYDRLSKIPTVDVISLAPNQSPASSRKALIARCSSEYIMMLDDDQVATASSELILQTISESTRELVGGIWLQDKNPDYGTMMTENDALSASVEPRIPDVERTCFGFTYTFSSEIAPGLVIKTPVEGSPRLKYLIDIDDLMPSIIARRDVFQRIDFDERYMYFFEWFDFYMQAKRAAIKCATHTGAQFLHVPERYACKSAAQLNPREEDRKRFFQKWGLIPLFSGETLPHQAVFGHVSW
jgi:GT2 family glycosyltransferase